MICPKCGESNSDNFRFCGMCGTLLEARRPVGAPVPSLASTASPRITNAAEPRPAVVAETAAARPNRHAPLISGPSMLGLNQPGPNQAAPNASSLNQPSLNQPNLDSLRDKAFSGLDSFFEPEEPTMGGRRIVLLVVLLAALGGAIWWTYTNYIGPAEARKPSARSVAPTADAGPSPAAVPSAAVPSAAVPDGPSENATTIPDSARRAKEADAGPKPAEGEKPVTPPPATRPATSTAAATTAPTVTSTVTAKKIPPPQKIAAKHEPRVTAPRASSAPAAADTGDADFRKGEAYLYGRGMPENCGEAVKYLKSASAKSNARARSAFGTMYATGHCAPRDLPTSYLWFALALKVDPNNQILEKDLSAVWNQMTPPERQMATRMKQ